MLLHKSQKKSPKLDISIFLNNGLARFTWITENFPWGLFLSVWGCKGPGKLVQFSPWDSHPDMVFGWDRENHIWCNGRAMHVLTITCSLESSRVKVRFTGVLFLGAYLALESKCSLYSLSTNFNVLDFLLPSYLIPPIDCMYVCVCMYTHAWTRWLVSCL